MMENRCECYRTMGDPTGENAVLCNAPGEYCPGCEKIVCAACHPVIAGAECVLNKKLPARASADAKKSASRRRA